MDNAVVISGFGDVIEISLVFLPTTNLLYLTASNMSISHPAPNPSIVYSFPTPDDLVDPLAAFILKAQKEAIDKKGKFTVALSGGSLPKMLRGLIGNKAVKWDLWY